MSDRSSRRIKERKKDTIDATEATKTKNATPKSRSKSAKRQAGKESAPKPSTNDSDSNYNVHMNQSKSSKRRGIVNFHNVVTDTVFPILGSITFIFILPFLAVQIGITTLWGRVLHPKWLHIPHMKWTSSVMTNAQDTHFIGWVLWLGFFLPWLWYEAFKRYGEWWVTIAAFNCIRIGPMYSNFAHVYTLCHMEAHHQYKLFLNSRKHPLAYVFNGWIGLWHGVLPGTFTHSHTKNHHRFNNSIEDQYSTAGYRRDSMWSWMRYLVTWFLYATNVSTWADFWTRSMWSDLFETIFGTLFYGAFVYACCLVTSPLFTACTVGWAFIEGNTLLSLVNFVWHMFLDENDDEFVESTTIENGEEFIFSEEYHVVHHAYPGIHHTRYRAMFEKNESKYSIVFQNVNLFELGFTAMLQNYERLASMVKDRKPETIDLLKKRLQLTKW